MVHETTHDAEQYVDSLRLDDDGPREVYGLDGAALWRIAEHHYLVLACTEHTHRGHELLIRVLPPTWVCFHSAINREDGFEAFHYGPDL
jgi:hypothetical protein